ncbi:MAG: beta-ketoacyl synthase N-terminal-like domain-containing protein [Kofleriaceae bacterium]
MIARFTHAVTGLGAVGPLGAGAAHLDALLEPASAASGVRARELPAGPPGAQRAALCDFPLEPLVPADERAQRLMSPAAKLAAIAVREARGAIPRAAAGERLAMYFGAGSSGDLGDDAAAVVKASLEDGAFSAAAFGRRGLRQLHPLRTFVLLTNFTMCHPAMLEGARGPNGVFFSRGSGTALALLEAAYELADGACDHALVGGADTAASPLTLRELARDGWLRRGLVPGEGAAALALRRADENVRHAGAPAHATGRDGDGAHAADVDDPRAPAHPTDDLVTPPLAYLTAIAIGRRAAHLPPGLGRDEVAPEPRDAALDDELASLLPGADLVLRMACQPDADALAALTRRAGGARGLELGPQLGDALAAAPALAWAVAVRAIARGHARRVVVVSRGLDHTWCAVAFARAREAA